MLIPDARNVQWFALVRISWLAELQILIKAEVGQFAFLIFHGFFTQSMVHFRLTAKDSNGSSGSLRDGMFERTIKFHVCYLNIYKQYLLS